MDNEQPYRSIPTVEYYFYWSRDQEVLSKLATDKAKDGWRMCKMGCTASGTTICMERIKPQ
jgi:hypothetical protein